MTVAVWPPENGGDSGGVTSINSETGDIDLTSADGSVTITPSGQTIDLSAQKLSTGNLTDVGTDGITVGNGSGAVVGTGTTISQHVADTSHNGYLSSTDWNTFNGKQASGSYITDLTGDVSASGPGSAAATLATVNTNVGSFTNASLTVNAKGLVTAASSGAAPVTAVSVASANGLAGSSSGGATPALTLSTSITGILKGNGTAISAATAGTDYSAGTSALATGILKSTTTTGALSIATAGTDYQVPITGGDGTASGGTLTLDTVNSNVGSFTNANITVNAKGLITSAANGTLINPTTSAISSTVIDWSILGNSGGVYTQTLSTNRVFTFSNQTAGQTIVVRLTNTSSNYTVTWPTVLWPYTQVPTMSPGAVSDLYSFSYDGTNTYGSVLPGGTLNLGNYAVDFQGTKGSNQSVTANTTDVSFTAVKDSNSGWGGSSYTVPLAGDYHVGGIVAQNGSTACNVLLYKNASLYAWLGALTGTPNTFNIIVPGLVASDTVSIRIDQSISVFGATIPSLGAASLSIFQVH